MNIKNFSIGNTIKNVVQLFFIIWVSSVCINELIINTSLIKPFQSFHNAHICSFPKINNPDCIVNDSLTITNAYCESFYLMPSSSACFIDLSGSNGTHYNRELIDVDLYNNLHSKVGTAIKGMVWYNAKLVSFYYENKKYNETIFTPFELIRNSILGLIIILCYTIYLYLLPQKYKKKINKKFDNLLKVIFPPKKRYKQIQKTN